MPCTTYSLVALRPPASSLHEPQLTIAASTLSCAILLQDKFVELHGDRAGLDDPAMVCGIGSMDGISFMFIGHQKGRNTKVRLRYILRLGCMIVASSWVLVAAEHVQTAW